jgi:CRP/FNR family transcriptional regulator, cyclic AMP receptor protein
MPESRTVTYHSYPPDSFLARLTDEDRDELSSLARPRSFGPKERLMRQGSTGDHVVLVHHGHVKVLTDTSDGRVVLLGVRRRGEVLGEIRYLTRQPRTATVIAAGRLQAYVLGFDVFEQYLRSRPQVWAELARCVADRLIWADRRRAEFALSVNIRIRKLLGELGQQVLDERQAAGLPVDPTNLEVPVTQRELGQLVGAAEVSVQKSLRELAEVGLVERRYGRIVITDLGGLGEDPDS